MTRAAVMPGRTERTMTTTERVEALLQLYHQLDALLTPDEMEMYPTLLHLEDLIHDLQIDIERAA